MYYLVTDENGNETVSHLSMNDVNELFTSHEQKELADGCVVVIATRGGMLRYVDMVVAARHVR